MTRDLQAGIEAILKAAPVVPVMVIERVADAVPLARALVRVACRFLKSPCAPTRPLSASAPSWPKSKAPSSAPARCSTPAQMADMDKLGCAFAVSPGSSPQLLEAAEDIRMPLLPGGVTASEGMALLEHGYSFQKFFPPNPQAVPPICRRWPQPLPQVRFCPTGGITLESAPRYLKLANVITVGGSWMVPKKLIEAGDWAGIEALAREASSLASADYFLMSPIAST